MEKIEVRYRNVGQFGADELDPIRWTVRSDF
jgi:hypothetical protein